MLHDAKYGEIPIGAALPSVGELPYDKQLEHRSVHFENHQISLPLDWCIEISPSRDRPKLPDMSVSASWVETLKNALKTLGKGDLRSTVCDMAQSEESMLQSAVSCRVRDFLVAVKSDNPESISEEVKKTLGLGMGLTPCCDDWLVGYLYATCRTGKTDTHRVVGDAVQKYAAKYTNSISTAYLEAAARGEYYEVLERCLFNEEFDSIVRLLSVGSSSGSDMLSGMIAACTN